MTQRRIAVFFVLAACNGTTPPARDAGSDGGFCSDGDGGFVAASDDVCDGVDNDCNGAVDDGPTVQLAPLLYVDADHDGFGDPHRLAYDQCVRPGLVLTRPDGQVDCDEQDSAVHPGAVEICNGIDDDCDGLVDDADTNGPNPVGAWWGLDEDADGYPSAVVVACASPGLGYTADSAGRAVDCGPLDPAVHPGALDDCATQTDRDCDGRFSPVRMSDGYYETGSRADAEALFTQAGPTDPPARIDLLGDVVLDLCPGTYRVVLRVWPVEYIFPVCSLVVRGRGATPDDVILDAAGAGTAIAISASGFFEFNPFVSARIENLTVTNATWSGLSVQDTPGTRIECDSVAFRHCTGFLGGGISLPYVGGPAEVVLVDTTFTDVHSTQAGGAIEAAWLRLTMTGGGFANVTAPVGVGSAINARFTDYSAIDLQGVDLSGVTDDIVLTPDGLPPGAPIVRDLGANANLHCDFATGCTP